jgi:type 1 glutamine amidotransferase/nicotinamidase-related amidase
MAKTRVGLSRAFLLSLTALPLLVPVSAHAANDADAPAGAIRLTERTRVETAPGSGRLAVAEAPAAWDPRKTALVIVDVWDKHWCAGANRRAAPIAARANDLAKALRGRGVLVVHAPSDTMKHYADHPARKLAQEAPTAKAALEFKWNYLDPKAEGALPIDDSDGGCDCEPQCKNFIAWTAEHPAVEVAPGDAVSDVGQEVFNLFQSRGIENVLVCGVHTNMCVLGRPFGIRMLTRLGKRVALVRDLTDTMYNPRMRPFVAHEKGTDLVVEHVERHWCPTVLSTDVLGDAKPAKVVVVTAEQEYEAKETLPAFFKSPEVVAALGKGVETVHLNSDSTTDIPGLDALDDADLLVLYARRRTLPAEQVERFRAYLAKGKPLVAVRTSSHAFENWPEFDGEVLGCDYRGHHGNDGTTAVRVAPGAEGDPLLRGVSAIVGKGSLYRSNPLARTATPLLVGTWTDKPEEPAAWTNTYKGGRVFYTSLGHADDFQSPGFRRLLLNAVLWGLDRPVPPAEAAAAK